MYWLIYILPYVIFALLIGGGYFLTRGSTNEVEKRHQYIHALAKDLGLHFDEGSNYFSRRHGSKLPSLKGTYRNVALNIYEEDRDKHSAKHHKYYTVYRASLQNIDLPNGFVIYKEGKASKVGKLFGGQDIQTNDPEFDKAFIIQGESPDQVRAFLNRPHVKQFLLIIHNTGGDFRIENNTLSLEFFYSLITYHELIHPYIDLLTKCVYAMAHAPQKLTPKPSITHTNAGPHPSLRHVPGPMPPPENDLPNTSDSW